MDENNIGANVQEVAEPVEANIPVEEANTTQESETKAEIAEQPRGEDGRDSAMARYRREAEAAKKQSDEARAEIERLNDESARLRRIVKRFEIEGDTVDDLEDAAESYYTGKPIEDIRASRAEKRRLQTLEAENKMLRERDRDRVFREDMELIKAAFPDETAASVVELGEDFLKLRAANVDTIIAYEAIRAKKALETKTPPPSTASVKSTAPKEKDFYTPEEVDNLTQKDLDNPRIFDTVLKSMTKWKK